MLSPLDLKGARAIGPDIIGKSSVAENAESVSIALPLALPFYYVGIMANWNCGQPYILSQTQIAFVLGFPIPAPAGGEILWKITH